jgi:ribosome-associated toxin RatA of RatAB toxin-antitoxin module
VLAFIFGRSFEQSLNALIDAFVTRAKSLHGERA